MSAASSADDRPRRRVLVIDDQLAMGTSLKLLLTAEHEVEVVTSAREALERFASRPYDVVLCDLQMPGVSGIELYQQLQTSNPVLARRFIFMTGGGTTPSSLRFVEETTQQVLEKPFAPGALRAAILAAAKD